MYRQLGWDVVQTPYVNDQGKDIILKKDGKTYFVECKKYADTVAVRRPDVNKLYGVMAAEKVDGGYIVTTGRFTAEAVEFATKTGIEMVGPQRLSNLMRQAFPNPEELQSVEVMCSECNEIVIFDGLRDWNFNDTRICRNGHLVKNSVFIEGKRLAFSKTLAPMPAKRRSYRKRRRYRRY